MGSMGVPCACAMRRLDDRLRMHSSAVRRVDGSICMTHGRAHVQSSDATRMTRTAAGPSSHDKA